MPSIPGAHELYGHRETSQTHFTHAMMIFLGSLFLFEDSSQMWPTKRPKPIRLLTGPLLLTAVKIISTSSFTTSLLHRVECLYSLSRAAKYHRFLQGLNRTSSEVKLKSKHTICHRHRKSIRWRMPNHGSFICDD